MPYPDKWMQEIVSCCGIESGGKVMNLIFSVLGLTGGILCAIGDILFDLKGKGNKNLAWECLD